MNEIYVTKLSGERELFSEEKLKGALLRAAVTPHLIDEVVLYIKSVIKDGISTAEIYHLAFSYLRQKEEGSAGRFGLRKAVMEMGPDGHPFEKLVAEIFEAQGFKAETSVVLYGKCVQHEVDVVATKGDRKIMVECKFHHEQEVKTDVKVALYVQARFEDLRVNQGFTEVWLVTNTKLSHDAITYGECVNMRVVGWSYPRTVSFQHLIENAGLHPVTILSTVSNEQKKEWMMNDMVSCEDVRKKENAFLIAGIKNDQRARVEAEMKQVIGR